MSSRGWKVADELAVGSRLIIVLHYTPLSKRCRKILAPARLMSGYVFHQVWTREDGSTDVGTVIKFQQVCPLARRSPPQWG
jgi:hypothetical protein